MEICRGGRGKFAHDEIVYDERICPLCKMMEEMSDLQSEISKLESEIDRLNEEE